jgi:hypothetical protein
LKLLLYAPILTTTNRKVKQTVDLFNTKVIDHQENEEQGILDRKKFIQVLTETNKGLVRQTPEFDFIQENLYLFMEVFWKAEP